MRGGCYFTFALGRPVGAGGRLVWWWWVGCVHGGCGWCWCCCVGDGDADQAVGDYFSVLVGVNYRIAFAGFVYQKVSLQYFVD